MDQGVNTAVHMYHLFCNLVFSHFCAHTVAHALIHTHAHTQVHTWTYPVPVGAMNVILEELKLADCSIRVFCS